MIMGGLSRWALLVILPSVAVLPALAAQAEAQTYTIVIDKMKFGAVPDGLRVGDTIIWQNHDMFRHTATASDKSFDLDLKPKAEGRVTLAASGKIDVICRFHPDMGATLNVGP